MNFKKYHVSKNLFDASVFSITYPDIISMSDTTIDVDLSNVSTSDRQALYNTGVPCAINAPFTISFKGVAKTNSATNGRLRLQFDDDSTDELYVTNNDGTPKDYSEGTFNKNLKAIKFNWSNYNSGFAFKELMINSSSEALPYEPYGNTWHDTSHYIHNTSTDTLTTLPADIYANDNNATVGLKGNMSQSGTPTPDSPVMPQETGERTGNLWDGNYENGLLNNDGTLNSPNFNYSTTTYILTEKENYTLSVVCNYDSGPRLLRICFYDENKNFISCIDSPQFRGVSFFYEFNFTAPSNSKYLRFSYIARSGVSDTNIMLNTGSTALPYEKFGYKIPILSGNTTTPVYLGEVESTRRIKKLVLTGEENWILEYTDNFLFNASINDAEPLKLVVCTHQQSISTGYESDTNFENVRISQTKKLNFRTRTIPHNLSDFKSYLQQQYAAGTPVTVWYVLAEPQTAIVNEPLRKIGDYADTVSGITIPTIAGTNTLSVDTTLQPSEVSVNYKGWHPVADVHERDNGAWT